MPRVGRYRSIQMIVKYETKDHDNLIEKKITYFLEYIRRVYYLDTQILNDKFVKNLSLKSGKE